MAAASEAPSGADWSPVSKNIARTAYSVIPWADTEPGSNLLSTMSFCFINAYTCARPFACCPSPCFCGAAVKPAVSTDGLRVADDPRYT